MKRLLFSILAVILLSVLVFTGCADEETTPPATTTEVTTTETATTEVTTTETTTVEATATASPTIEPEYGGTLSFVIIGAEMPFGDPLIVYGPWATAASVPLERLILPGSEIGTYEYVLATGFEMAPDKSYYDISLREGVTFHDGTPFNAQAVKWNFDRILDAGRSEFSKVSSFEVIDDFTLRMNLSSWDNRVLNDLMHDPCLIISPTSFEENGADWAKFNPVGTGPFVLEKIMEDKSIVYAKNPNYWDEGLPYLDSVEFHNVSDKMVIEASLLSGEIDGCSKGSLSDAIEKNSDFRGWVCDGEFLIVLWWNNTDPDSIWADERVRQAFEYAIDKDSVLNSIGDGYVEPVYNIIKGLEHSTDTGITPRTYDPDKARELMEAAGYPEVTITVYVSTSGVWAGNDKYYLLAFQEQWAEVGFNIEFEVIESGKYMQFKNAGMTGNSLLGDTMRGNKDNPAEVILESLSEGTIYFKGVQRPSEWSDLFAQALQTEDKSEELSLLAQMDKIAYDQAMLVPLYSHPLTIYVNNRVHDIDRTREQLDLRHTWKEKE